MGLDAGVRCRCWEEGLCAPTRLKPHIYLDAGSDSLDIALPWETHEMEVLEFDRWVEQACAHPGMRQAQEHVQNWAGVRAFQNALRTIDEECFRTLLREIPNSNGGLTLPEAAKDCLQELNRFQSTGTFGRHIGLVDSDTGSRLAERIDAYDGWFAASGQTGYEFSLAGDGHMLIRQKQLGIVFRAKAFTQSRTPDGQFIYTNLLDGAQCVCPNGLEDDEASEYPSRLNVVVDYDSVERHSYIFNALRRVFSAAIETGHPVSWS